MDTLASLLKQHRKRSGLTQKELSERINFHHTVISRAEKPYSGYLPTRAFVDQFCAALALSAEERAQIEAAYERAVRQRASVQEQPGESGGVDLRPRAPEGAASTARPVLTALVHSRRGRLWTAACLLALLSIPILLPYLRQRFARLQYALAPVDHVLYQENFEDFSDSGVVSPDDWEYLNFGKWEVRTVDGNQVFGVFQPDPNVIPNAFLSRSLAWEDYSVSADFEFQAGVFEQIYFIVRNGGQKDNCTGYRVGGNRLGMEIFRFESEGRCHGKTLARDFFSPLLSNHVYHMRVEAVGSQIRLLLNNELVLEAEDERYRSGGIVLQAHEVDWAWFDNIRVEKQ